MMRQPIRQGRAQQQEIGRTAAGPSPVLGWNTRDAVADMAVGYATILDNWLPTVGKLRTRAGATDWLTGTTASGTVFPWNGPSSSKAFVANSTGLYDASAAGAVGASVLARTEGYHNYINFTTTGGQYVVLVNGADPVAYYQGTTWTTVASFTISSGPDTLAAADIVNISSFKRQLFFIKKNSMSFFYLAVDSVTGNVYEYPLGALFGKGGRLLASATWTIDGGSGIDDFAAFITTKGQLAIYQGTDPSSSATWALRGVYDLAVPLGPKCFCKFGGDLLALTSHGVVSISQVLRETKLTDHSLISSVVGEAFQAAYNAVGVVDGWEILECPEQDLLICNIPQPTSGTYYQFVMNTKTGAWSRITGWNVSSLTLFERKVLGSFGAKVGEIFAGTTDFGSPVTSEARTAFSYYNPRSRIKSWKAIRPVLTILGSATVSVGVDTDFQDTASYTSSLTTAATLSLWDIGTWDSTTWAEFVLKNEWLTVSAEDSYSAAVRLRATTQDAIITWSGVDVLYTVGSIL